VAGVLAITNLVAAILGLTRDFRLIGLSAFLLVFEGMILAQPRVVMLMYSQYLRERFQASLSGPSKPTGLPVMVRR
jgi:hypothetical protein